MAYTQSDLDALKAAYKPGAERIRLADGREWQFRSTADFLALCRVMQTEIDALAGKPVTRLLRMAGGGKGV